MRGLWLQDLILSLRRNLPEPVEGECLTRVLLAGICNTDLELIKGYYPFTGVLGHEFVGVVEQGSQDIVGERVVGDINASCGKCEFCVTQMPTHCARRTVLGIVGRDGAFADYLVLPKNNLHVVPDSFESEIAVFTEPLAAALEIQEQVHIDETHRVLVVGDGKLGQLIAQALAMKGCDLCVVGRHADKLAFLKNHGVRTAKLGKTAGRSFDVAVVCTGSPGGFEVARQSLKPRGILVLKSTYSGNLDLDAAPIVVDELTIVGSRCGPFAPAVAMLDSGALNVGNLISGRMNLDRGVEAIALAAQPGVLKVLIEIGIV